MSHTDDKPPEILKGAGMIDALNDLLEGFESGVVKAAALRLQNRDGSWEEVALGFDTEEERDAAIAELRRALGHLS